MPGLSSYAAQGILGHITGKAAIFSIPTAYVALFTVLPADDGTGGTEVSGSAYARVVTSGSTWNAASGSAPSVITNAASITFPVPTGSWGTVVGFGLYDASTSGNYLAGDYLGAFLWLPVTISTASPGVWTSHAHGFSASDSVVYVTEYGGTAPTLVGGSGALTGVLTVLSPSTDTFTLENGATAINTSGTGDGMVRKVASVAISSSSGAMSFAASALTIDCN